MAVRDGYIFVTMPLQGTGIHNRRVASSRRQDNQRAMHLRARRRMGHQCSPNTPESLKVPRVIGDRMVSFNTRMGMQQLIEKRPKDFLIPSDSNFGRGSRCLLSAFTEFQPMLRGRLKEYELKKTRESIFAAVELTLQYAEPTRMEGPYVPTLRTTFFVHHQLRIVEPRTFSAADIARPRVFQWVDGSRDLAMNRLWDFMRIFDLIDMAKPPRPPLHGNEYISEYKILLRTLQHQLCRTEYTGYYRKAWTPRSFSMRHLVRIVLTCYSCVQHWEKTRVKDLGSISCDRSAFLKKWFNPHSLVAYIAGGPPFAPEYLTYYACMKKMNGNKRM